jgi:hypothetical protein
MNFSVIDIATKPLTVIEKTISEYIAIAERCDYDITPQFQNELEWLISMAKAKGSTKL